MHNWHVLGEHTKTAKRTNAHEVSNYSIPLFQKILKKHYNMIAALFSRSHFEFIFVGMFSMQIVSGDGRRQLIVVVSLVVGHRTAAVRRRSALHPRAEHSRHPRDETTVGRRAASPRLHPHDVITSRALYFRFCRIRRHCAGG